MASRTTFFLFLCVSLIVFSCKLSAVSQLTIDEVEPYEQITVRVISNNLTSTYDTITVDAEIKNTDEKPYVIYLMSCEGAMLRAMKVLGVIEPMSKVTATVKIGVHYPEKTYNKKTYAIVLSDEKGVYKGKTFDVVEDWSGYETSVASSLIRAHVLAMPLISLTIILLILVLMESAYHHKFPGVIKDEYTVSTLFFPKLQGRPTSEKITDIMTNPLFWLIEIAFSLFMFAFLVKGSIPKGEIGFEVLLFSGLAAFILPLIYLSMLWVLEKKPLRFFVSLFIFGMISAFFAFVANTVINEQVKALTGMDTVTFLLLSAVIIAPVAEESIKSIGILFFSGHHEFDDALTGLMFGFAIGLGFAFMENWFYFTSKSNPFDIGFVSWIQLVVYRSFFNSLAHGSITGLGGSIVGYVKSITQIRKYLFLGFLSALLIMMPLHSLFNLTALIDGGIKGIEEVYGLPFVFNPLFVMMLTILYVIAYTLSARQRRMREKEER